MAAVTPTIYTQVAPNTGWRAVLVVCPSTMDSADTVNLGTYGGFTIVDYVMAWDQTTGDAVTVTVSGVTATVDAAGGTTDHAVSLFVIGR